MHTSEHEKRRLYEAALEAYQEYGHVKTLLRRDHKNPDYGRRLKKVRVRYERLRLMLNEPPPGSRASTGTKSSALDFDALAYDLPSDSAFVNAPSVADEPWTNKARTWARWTRNVVLVMGLSFVALVSASIATERTMFFRVPTSSMEPTLRPNDRLVAHPAPRYVRGDIVVAHHPSDSDAYVVKRIVGVAGDDVAVRHGRLYVNDRPIHETYIAEAIDYEMAPFPVRENEVFLLGDNRNESDDGHLWLTGTPTASIVGKVRFVYSPAERRQALDHHGATFARIP